MAQNETIVTMTVGDLNRLIAEAVSSSLQPVVEKFEQMLLPRDSEISGRDNIAKILGTNRKAVTKLADTGVLGHALWKHNVSSKSNNGKMTVEVEKAQRRYKVLQRMSHAEADAWYQLGADIAEAEWQSIDL